ncbi:MAG TPA: hypothetical protein ENN43_02595 [bacterium]|nr:hypothetical protein [bacterium]
MRTKHLPLPVFLAVILSLFYAGCSPKDSSGPSQPGSGSTPVYGTNTITPTPEEALPTPATPQPGYIVSAEFFFSNSGTDNPVFQVRVNNGSTDGNHASLVRVLNMSKSLACTLPYESASSSYRIDAHSGALAYYSGDTYRVEATILGSVFLAQSAAPGSASISDFDAVSGVSITMLNDGNEDRIIVYDEAADSIIFDKQEPGDTVDNPYTIPSSVFTIGKNYNVTAFVTKALSQSASVFSGLHHYSYFFISYAHDRFFENIGVPSPTVTCTLTPEPPSPTLTITATRTPEPSSTPENTATFTPSPWPTDAYEPDNTYLQARELNAGTEEGRSLSPFDDEDWYKITTTGPSIVTITVTAHDPEFYAGTYVYYYTETGAPSLSHYWLNTGNANISPAHYSQFLEPGVYYIRIVSGFGHVFGYSITCGLTEFTPTVTPTVTASPSVTPTPTMTYSMDAYEPNDDALSATLITIGVPQTHSIWPVANNDWVTFDLDFPNLVSAVIDGEDNTYYKIDLYCCNASSPVLIGSDNYSEYPGHLAAIHPVYTPGPYFVKIQGDQSFSYNITILLDTFTPSPSSTITATITPTYTITQTQTASPTPTFSPTNTPKWETVNTHGSSTQTNTKISSNGSAYSYAYLLNGPNLYVDGSFAGQAEAAYMGSRWLHKTESAVYAAYTAPSTYQLSVKSSANWSSAIGASPGEGYFPNIYIDGSTPYVCYADMNNVNKIAVKYYNGSSWADYSTQGISGSVDAFGFGNMLVMDGYNTSGLRLYAAYINDSDSRRVYCIYHDGSGWADLGSPVFDNAAVDVDICAVDDDNVFAAVMRNNGSGYAEIYVKKYAEGAWVDVGSAPVFTGMATVTSKRNISIHAVSGNDIWLLYEYTGYGFIAAKHWDGVSWKNRGPSGGFYSGSYPSAAVVNGVIHAGFIDGTLNLMRVMKYE